MRAIRHRRLGHTLVELVTVITVAGVMGVGTINLIGTMGRVFWEQTFRERSLTQQTIAMRRMVREINHAVPNSFTIADGGATLSFDVIHTSGVGDVAGGSLTDAENPHLDPSCAGMLLVARAHGPSPTSTPSRMEETISSCSGGVIQAPVTASWPDRYFVTDERVTYRLLGDRIVRNTTSRSGSYVARTGNQDPLCDWAEDVQFQWFDADQILVGLTVTHPLLGETVELNDAARVFSRP